MVGEGGGEEGGRLSKNVDHQGWPTTKNALKLSPPKKKFVPKYKWFKNLIFGIIFLKILFRAYKVFIFVQTFQWISSEFFLFSDFLAESLKGNKNWQKRSHILQYSFAQKISLILRKLTHLTLKTICSRNATKNLSDFTNFQETCLLHHFLTPKNCILEPHWKQMPEYFFISP